MPSVTHKNGTLTLLMVVLGQFLIRQSDSAMVLWSLSMNSNTQTFTVPYNQSLTAISPSFAYFVESGTIKQTEFRLTHDASQTMVGQSSITIKFTIEGSTVFTALEVLNVRVLITDYASSEFSVGVETRAVTDDISIGLPAVYVPSATIKEVFWKVYTLNFPMTFTQSITNGTTIKIRPNLTPIALSNYSIAYIIVTKGFLSENIAIFFDSIDASNLAWILLLNNETMVDPTDSNTFLAITEYEPSSSSAIILQTSHYVDHDYNYALSSKRALYVSYSVTGSPSTMNAAMFIFNNDFQRCPQGQYLTYNTLFYGSPKQCDTCHETCVACTSSNHSLDETDQFSCTECGGMTYLDEDTQSEGVGQCHCLPGMEVAADGSCLECTFSCLTFDVEFMTSSTKSEFLVIFSDADVREQIAFEENLRVYINQNADPVAYEAQKLRNGFYSVWIALQYLEVCSSACEIKFEFRRPDKILKSREDVSLSTKWRVVELEKYYNVADELPEEMDEAVLISSMLVGASMGGGLSSLVKMMFELEQIIEFHKYLDVELPLIFKEFIESLSIFKFLDVTATFPFDLNEELIKLSTSELDNKGPIKALYYETGCNFYKNIIPIITSFVIVLLINFLLFGLFRLIPTKTTWRFSEKIRIRKLITVLDLTETMILPVLVFAQFQLFFIYYNSNFFWMYSLMAVSMFCILAVPFLVATFVRINKHNKKMEEIYEDLLQDCSLNHWASYVFYISTYYRKVSFALALTHGIPGTIQNSALVVINGCYLGVILYIIGKKVYKSTIKMLTKTVITVCVLGIEVIMIYYNSEDHELSVLVDMGITCVYLALIATAAGILEAVIKVCEMIFQNVSEAQADSEKSSVVESEASSEMIKPEKQFIHPLYHNIGKDVVAEVMARQTKNEKVDPLFIAQPLKASKNKQKHSIFNPLSILQYVRGKDRQNSPSRTTALQGTGKSDDSNDQIIFREDDSNSSPHQEIDLVSMESLDQMDIDVKNQKLHERRLERDKQRAFKFIKQSFDQKDKREKVEQKPAKKPLYRSATKKQPSASVGMRRNFSKKEDPRGEDEVVMMPSDIDREIKETQKRLRENKLKKQASLLNPHSGGQQTNATLLASSPNPSPMQNLNRGSWQNANNEAFTGANIHCQKSPDTQRKREVEEAELFEELDQKQTRRRRGNAIKKSKNSQGDKSSIEKLEVLNDNKREISEDQQLQPDDIYYAKN